MNVDGRVAIVTGGGGGIGGALSRALVAGGARVVVTDLEETKAAKVADALGDSAIAVGADVASTADLQMLITRTEQTFGPVELFFANAGVGEGAGLAAGEEIWDLSIDVNVRAHVRAAQLLVPGWLERGEGYFVATASAAGLLSQIGSAAYSVTKHAAVGFAEWLAITYGSRGVRVSCLCPMGVDTDMLNGGLDDDSEDGLGARVVAAAGDVLSPDEVAERVLETVAAERFLVLPHPEVLEFYRRKGSDYDRWLAGMQRLQDRVANASVAPGAG